MIHPPPATGTRLHVGALESDPTLDIALASAMLTEVDSGEASTIVRVYRPRAPVVAFGRRETRLSGFLDAVRCARHAGFTPVVRPVGGRAVAYTPAAWVVDVIGPRQPEALEIEDRFAHFGATWVQFLRARGVDARLGPVPGEYCLGAHSVNARGAAKLVGTAQRVVRRGWLFSALLVVEDATVIREVLEKVYAHLGQPFDGESVGTLLQESTNPNIATLGEDIATAFAPGLDPSPVPETAIGLARTLVPQHRATAKAKRDHP